MAKLLRNFTMTDYTNLTLDDARITLIWLLKTVDEIDEDTTLHNTIAILDNFTATNAVIQTDRDFCPSLTQFDNILALFSTAKKNGQDWPKINLGTDYKLTLQTNRKNQINITNGERYGSPENIWYGRIEPTGKIIFRDSLTEQHRTPIKDLLRAFNDDPARYAKILADETCHCAFCNRALTNEISKQMGYGPICADTYGLPYSDNSI